MVLNQSVAPLETIAKEDTSDEMTERKMYYELKMLIYSSKIPSTRDALMEASRTWEKEFKERYGKDVIPA